MAGKTALENLEGEIKKEWATGVTTRQPYEDRAKLYATLTLKYLYPDVSEGSDSSTLDMTGDWQIDGPIFTNHLANLYMSTLFPPNQSFFKLSLPDDKYTELEEDGLSKVAIEFALSRMEADTRKLMLQIGGRPALLDAIKHLIVAGNALLYYPKEGNLQTYALDEFVITRDPDGEILSLITRDTKGFLTLPENIRELVRKELDVQPEEEAAKNVDLFTRIKLSPESKDYLNPTYVIQQAVDTIPIPDTEFEQKRKELRWIPIGWHRTRRESYHRGLIELIYPALYNISVLTEAVIKGAAVVTDVKFTVEPDSMIDIPSMNSAGPGTYHYGSKDDVNVITTGGLADWSFIQGLIDSFVNKLSKVFLMAVTRDAERVTAEEIRMVTRELETAHGGVFGSLAQTLQLQLGRLLLEGIDANINDTKVALTILTGLDALGRSVNNDNMRAFATDLTLYDTIPDAFKSIVKPREMFIDLAAGRDVDYTKWTKTPEELDADTAQAKADENESLLMGGAAKGMGQQVANMPQDEAMAMAGAAGSVPE